MNVLGGLRAVSAYIQSGFQLRTVQVLDITAPTPIQLDETPKVQYFNATATAGILRLPVSAGRSGLIIVVQNRSATAAVQVQTSAGVNVGSPIPAGGEWVQWYQVDFLALTWSVVATNARISNGTKIELFTTVGVTVWTKEAGAKLIQLAAMGGAGGGGSGRKGALASVSSGGTGGAGSGCNYAMLPASVLGATENVTVGDGGTGGAAQVANSTDGNPGQFGGTTTFGAHLKGAGTSPGAGGTNGTPNGGSGAVLSQGTSPAGANAGAAGAAGVAGNASPIGMGGSGASGGGVSVASVRSIGGVGGTSGGNVRTGAALAGGTAGALDSGVAAGAGASLALTTVNPTGQMGGAGGGGGGSSGSGGPTNGGDGGAGGAFGGGGGGGGACIDATGNSGAGGKGGQGVCIVITYF